MKNGWSELILKYYTNNTTCQAVFGVKFRASNVLRIFGSDPRYAGGSAGGSAGESAVVSAAGSAGESAAASAGLGAVAYAAASAGASAAACAAGGAGRSPADGAGVGAEVSAARSADPGAEVSAGRSAVPGAEVSAGLSAAVSAMDGAGPGAGVSAGESAAVEHTGRMRSGLSACVRNRRCQFQSAQQLLRRQRLQELSVRSQEPGTTSREPTTAVVIIHADADSAGLFAPMRYG